METCDIKIQFGAGGNILPGWQNYDVDVDIRNPLPFPDNYASIVFAEHVAEHITQQDCIRFLMECYRILQPGGTLRLCVPVVSHVDPAKALDLIFNHGHLAYYNASLLQLALIISGFHPFSILATPRMECDGHWRVIGKEQDDLETVRLEATK